MKIQLTCLIVALVSIPLAAPAAHAQADRSCNQQGREIALRISEEVNSDMAASDRNRIAAIAEEVCRDFAATQAAPAQARAPVVSRPATAQSAAQAVAPVADATGPEEEDEVDEEEDESGLFGNLRIIEPEDRVRRPGLKRP